ncbi:MAG: hypothetical protein DSY42_01150 [Aquifex sp.]|nr:MAG: hypothetical protein DSY42_01150 [Aquifex sp.]
MPVSLKKAYEILEREEKVIAIAKGNSMKDYVPNNSIVKIRKFLPEKDTIRKGTIVLCKVKGKVYLHLVGAVKSYGKRKLYRIENARGKVNGWIPEKNIRGILEEIIKQP